jgi:hypothetical protein
MGAPVPEFEASENPTAEALLGALRTIDAAERRKHATVYSYWLSIRGDRAFPAIRDLNPLEISDAGPHSLLLEVVGGGEDAEIRHIGHAIKGDISAEKLSDVGGKSFLACIAAKLPVLAATRDAFAFEDDFEGEDGPTRCWVTLLPFTTGGTFVDYAYGFVTLGGQAGESADSASAAQAEQAAEAAAAAEEDETELVLDQVVDSGDFDAPDHMTKDSPLEDPDPEPQGAGAGFSARFSQALKNVPGFYGRVTDLELGEWQVEDVTPEVEAEAGTTDVPEQTADEPAGPGEPEEEEAAMASEEPETAGEQHEPEPAPEQPEPEPAPEQPEPETQAAADVPLHSRLADVRAKTDEARLAKLRSNVALYEGLSAAYDFALDAEDYPEDYLKILESRGLKIKLRSPMAPVVRLAFEDMCDDSTIAQLESVLAWAFEHDLPRGSLAERIEAEGGIGAILSREG